MDLPCGVGVFVLVLRLLGGRRSRPGGLAGGVWGGPPPCVLWGLGWVVFLGFFGVGGVYKSGVDVTGRWS